MLFLPFSGHSGSTRRSTNERRIRLWDRHHGEGIDPWPRQDPPRAALTFAEAADFNTAFLRDVADNIAAAAAKRRSAVMSPSVRRKRRRSSRRCLCRPIGLIEAWYANFGDCLFTAIAAMFDRGHSAAVVLNSDSPTLPTSLLTETARLAGAPGRSRRARPIARRRLLSARPQGAAPAPVRTTWPGAPSWSRRRPSLAPRRSASPVDVLPEWYDVDDAQSLQLCAELDGVAAIDPNLRPHAAVHSGRADAPPAGADRPATRSRWPVRQRSSEPPNEHNHSRPAPIFRARGARARPPPSRIRSAFIWRPPIAATCCARPARAPTRSSSRPPT